MFKMKITPKFNARTIVNKFIGKNFAKFEADAINMAEDVVGIMRDHIKSNANRGSTGRLGNIIDTEFFDSLAGTGKFSMGIGNIDKLNSNAPYWYVLNFGRYFNSSEQFIPGKKQGAPMGKVQGFFGEGDAPDPSMKGTGSDFFTHASNTFAISPGVIRPINYIDVGIQQFNRKLNKILRNLGK